MLVDRRRAALIAASAVIPAARSAAAPAPDGPGRAAEPFALRRFGAIGDGRSHPLSARFRTLKDAQSEWPKAIALTQEIDTCALQAAVDAAQAAGGGVVTAESGTFIIDRSVVFPEARQGIGDGPNGGVSLRGAGQGATVFKVIDDFPGYVLTCANRFTTQWGSQGFWQDFSVLGPGKQPGWGEFACRTGGLGWGARRIVSRVTVQDCRVGMSITGDQALIDRFETFSCTYGLYFDKPNPALFGDLLFEKLILDGSWRAAVGVHPDGNIPKSLWLSCIFSASPFAIYKEFGGSSRFAARSVHMMHHQFENIGLAAMSGGDAEGRDIGTRPDIQNLRLTMCQFGPWNDGRQYTGWRRAAMLDLGECHQGLIIDGINDPNLWTPGEVALMRFDYPGSVVLSGDIGALLLACHEAGRPFLVMKSRSDDIEVEDTGRWRGHVYQMEADQRASPGDVLTHYNGNVARSRGTAAEQVAGICMSAPTRPYEAVVVATQGQVVVNGGDVKPTGSILYSGQNGKASDAAIGPRLGWAAAISPDQARVRLAGLQ